MPNAIWIVIAVCLFDLVFFPLLVRALVQGTWGPLAARYPLSAPGDDSVRRDFQSYKVGLLNLGWSLHTTVDGERLHLEPASALRLIGMKGASIPWNEIEPVRRRGKKYVEVKIAGQAVLGPAWALGMAFAGGEGT
jgi:hypothetical protein